MTLELTRRQDRTFEIQRGGDDRMDIRDWTGGNTHDEGRRSSWLPV